MFLSIMDYCNREELREEVVSYLVNYAQRYMQEFMDSYIRTEILPTLKFKAWNKKLPKCIIEIKMHGSRVYPWVIWDYKLPMWTNIYERDVEVALLKQGPMVGHANSEFSCSPVTPLFAFFPLKDFIERMEKEGITCKKMGPFQFQLSVDMPTEDKIKDEQVQEPSQTIAEHLRNIRRQAVLTGQKKSFAEILQDSAIESKQCINEKKKEIINSLIDFVPKKLEDKVDEYVFFVLKELQPKVQSNPFATHSVTRDLREWDDVWELIKSFPNTNPLSLCSEELYELFVKGRTFVTNEAMTLYLPLDLLIEKLSMEGVHSRKVDERTYEFSIFGLDKAPGGDSVHSLTKRY